MRNVLPLFPFSLNSSGSLGLLTILMIIAFCLFGPVLFGLEPYEMSDDLLSAPNWLGGNGGVLGTDDLGRDQLARLVYGARSSLAIGVVVVFISCTVGALLGLYAACFGGAVDRAITRLVDVIMSLPSILLAIVIVAVLGPGLVNAMFAVALVSMPRFVRIVRAVALAEMQKQYISAARTCGASTQRIIWSEVLPNCWGAIIVQASLGFSDAILEIAALGFLGLGAQPPTAEWGAMLADSRAFIASEPQLMLFPGLCIFLTVISFNLLGDALQDLLDPRLGGRR
ncbi:peptide transporter [Pseudomonas agarici]|uniref:Peptide transporter n=1 Tax=Pseudomonas agarici TaxID=46677 RepID=A0A0X1T2M0_PSEAA|nr:ABC transporter permease [Pseudomonas agarici]AMB86303.1 peptide transporter [Pseudomonas agarici]NWB90342.1 ABC transporter permease [Pseudomonas agarici]